MNRAFLLGGLFLRVTAVYAAATHGDLIAEGRRRNEEAYEQSLEHTGWNIGKVEEQPKPALRNSNERVRPAEEPKNS
jgi:hypothetical protein